MKKTQGLMLAVGAIQFVLGLAYLLAPHAMLAWMGHSAIAADIAYPLGMLAARFLVYGILLVIASREPARYGLLVTGMVGIQVVDLAVGVYHTASGTVPLSLSAFPMFNAALIALLLWWWRPLPARSA